MAHTHTGCQKKRNAREAHVNTRHNWLYDPGQCTNQNIFIWIIVEMREIFGLPDFLSDKSQWLQGARRWVLWHAHACTHSQARTRTHYLKGIAKLECPNYLPTFHFFLDKKNLNSHDHQSKDQRNPKCHVIEQPLHIYIRFVFWRFPPTVAKIMTILPLSVHTPHPNLAIHPIPMLSHEPTPWWWSLHLLLQKVV